MRFQVRINKDDYLKMGYLLAAYDVDPPLPKREDVQEESY
jgi:hypothetical protein